MSAPTFRVVYGNPVQEATVSTSAELDRVLGAEHARAEAEGWPTLVHIEASDGTGLMIGVGRDFSPLVHEDTNVPGDLDNGNSAVWLDLGEYSELPPGMAVEASLAWEAAREFVRTGRRPTGLPWST